MVFVKKNEAQRDADRKERAEFQAWKKLGMVANVGDFDPGDVIARQQALPYTRDPTVKLLDAAILIIVKKHQRIDPLDIHRKYGISFDIIDKAALRLRSLTQQITRQGSDLVYIEKI